ncbi:MAG: SDR family oxidoreductase [Erysipelotrichaceae bacterium]|nr:SDR family oxidoreductase [Erysipelotrichaceae bacterium]
MKEFENKVVVITGADRGIGLAIRRSFESEGARVYSIDLKGDGSYKGDISKKDVLEDFVSYVLSKEDHIDYLINNAPPRKKGISNCSYEEFEEALRVGVTAPFYLSKLFKDRFNIDGCIINISSTRDSQSQIESESYAAAKGGIRALTHALAVSLQGKVRVNSISPGWIDTEYREYEGSDADQHLVKRVGNPDDIAEAVLFLCSEKASFIDGENIVIDGGMSKLMIYHDDYNWELKGD